MPAPSLRRFRCTGCGGEVPIPTDGTRRVACPGCGLVFPVEDGIIGVGPAPRDSDYPPALVDLIANVERKHFWFAARNDVILSTMRRAIGALEGRSLLDVGCGTGFVLAALEKAGLNACGIDMHRSSLLGARARFHGPLVWSNATALPFFDDFDIVTLFDVIEHADDDAGVLRQAREVLRPNGFVVITVPAGQDLWTTYDEASGHKRRYERPHLADVLERSGFAVRHITYFNVLPLVAQRIHRRFATRSDAGSFDGIEVVRQALRVPPEPLNSVFRLLIWLEGPLRALPWVRGGSLIAVAQRVD